MKTMLLNDGEQDLIQQNNKDNHNIQKYQFKPIENMDSMEEKMLEPLENDMQDSAPSVTIPQTQNLERELIERLLQKTDELSSSLAKMQIQVEKQQLDMEDRLSVTKSDAYKDGLKEGEEAAKAALEGEINKEKQALINAIVALDTSLQNSVKRLDDFEKELAQIALDIAKEVIVKEIEESSAKVAQSLASALIDSIRDVTEVCLRVNPLDYSYLRENLDLKNITLEADENIQKGGVVITSASGNIDGNIMTRFRLLKQKVLEES